MNTSTTPMTYEIVENSDVKNETATRVEELPVAPSQDATTPPFSNIPLPPDYSVSLNKPPVQTSTTTTTTTASSPSPKKRIILAVTGEKFSNSFLLAWTTTIYALWETNKYEIVISPGSSSFLPFARMQTLGVDVRRGKYQKPYNGEMDYFAYINIDHDIIFNSQAVMELLNALEIQPVVCGFYALADGKSFSAAKEFDTAHFAEHGVFKCLNTETMTELKEKNKDDPLISVVYSGLGFFGVRKEVLDNMTYPYFDAPLQRVFKQDGTELTDMCSEDVAFCKNIQSAGYMIHLHTGIRVGHELSIIL